MTGGLAERAFYCPYCGEPVSTLVDLSVEGPSESIEDCEVCCRPIQFRMLVTGGELADFDADRSD